MAVAIWSSRPEAEQLLQWRLSWGWQPTPTMLQTGAEILGYAAGCRLKL